ncbi:hypothetical protein AQ490_10150 [Wenjunlia vitaminophila]|uniref:Lipoprotein n=1 Tax=Wenjunlia vitaminophila TaxID=76728 RepID=A0A0T6LLZ8_WENVI|nr:hypothetical protein [Wenjunlia vitaminophila]KRV47102.1 hypothetical protein AQ490_10150 [Wenjunlia vitaminophila]
MRIMRGLASATAVCALVVGAAACGDNSDDSTGRAGNLGRPDNPNNPDKPEEPKQEPNGVEKLTASEIVDKAMDAMEQASAFRVTGTGDESVAMELALDDSGNCQGTVGKEGAETKLASKDGKIWLKPNGPFWDMFAGADADAAKTVVGDRYLLLSEGQDGYSDIAETCTLSELTESFTSGGDDLDATNKGEVSEVNGVPAVEVSYEAPDETGTMWVSTVGKPYPLKIVLENDSKPGAITFSDYDKPVQVQIPPDDQVLDMAQLEELATAGTSSGTSADAGTGSA